MSAQFQILNLRRDLGLTSVFISHNLAAPRSVRDGETMVACHLHDGGTELVAMNDRTTNDGTT